MSAPFDPSSSLQALLGQRRVASAIQQNKATDVDFDDLVSQAEDAAAVQFKALREASVDMLRSSEFRQSLIQAIEAGVQKEFFAGFVSALPSDETDSLNIVSRAARDAGQDASRASAKIKKYLSSMGIRESLYSIALPAAQPSDVDKFLADCSSMVEKDLIGFSAELKGALESTRGMGGVYQQARQGSLAPEETAFLNDLVKKSNHFGIRRPAAVETVSWALAKEILGLEVQPRQGVSGP